jgi:RNA polymerase sigma factor (sigma-70 family)
MPTMRKPQAPDAAEIGRLYARHADELLAFFARRTFDPQVALDLVGETFAEAFDSRTRCRATDDVARCAWIYGIARNLLNSYYRDGAIERRAMQKLAIVAPAMSDESTVRIEQLADLIPLRVELRAALDGLSDEQRDVIALRVLDERPYPEIATTLGISEQVVRARLSRGLRALHDVIDAKQSEEVGDALGA